jgi:hypothetical protein
MVLCSIGGPVSEGTNRRPWDHPARPTKITFAQVRDGGVRGLLFLSLSP